MNMKQKVQKGIAEVGFIMLSKAFSRAIGLDASILLSELMSKDNYFEKHNDQYDGWFFNTRDNLYRDTALSPHRQRGAEERLMKEELITVKRRGIPARNFYRIRYEEIDKKLLDAQSSDTLTITHQSSGQLGVQIRNGNNNKNNNKNKNKNDDQQNHHALEWDEDSEVETDNLITEDGAKRLNDEQNAFLAEYRKCYEEYFQGQQYAPTGQDIRRLKEVESGVIQNLSKYLMYWFHWKNDVYRDDYIKNSDASITFLLYQPVKDKFLDCYDEGRIGKRRERYRLKLE